MKYYYQDSSGLIYMTLFWQCGNYQEYSHHYCYDGIRFVSSVFINGVEVRGVNV